MEIKYIIVSSVEAFQFSKFHKNVTKHDKYYFKEGLTVIFVVEICKISGKIGKKFYQLTFFVGR